MEVYISEETEQRLLKLLQQIDTLDARFLEAKWFLLEDEPEGKSPKSRIKAIEILKASAEVGDKPAQDLLKEIGAAEGSRAEVGISMYLEGCALRDQGKVAEAMARWESSWRILAHPDALDLDPAFGGRGSRVSRGWFARSSKLEAAARSPDAVVVAAKLALLSEKRDQKYYFGCGSGRQRLFQLLRKIDTPEARFLEAQRLLLVSGHVFATPADSEARREQAWDLLVQPAAAGYAPAQHQLQIAMGMLERNYQDYLDMERLEAQKSNRYQFWARRPQPLEMSDWQQTHPAYTHLRPQVHFDGALEGSKESEKAEVYHQLGLAYCYGEGLEKNPERATYWLHMASMRRNLRAMCVLQRPSINLIYFSRSKQYLSGVHGVLFEERSILKQGNNVASQPQEAARQGLAF